MTYVGELSVCSVVLCWDANLTAVLDVAVATAVDFSAIRYRPHPVARQQQTHSDIASIRMLRHSVGVALCACFGFFEGMSEVRDRSESRSAAGIT